MTHTQAWENVPNIQWYGERGIVNAIVTHIQRQEDFVEAAKNLLRAIVWADHGNRSWIESITDVKLVVEMGLAEFGDPDLVVVCRADDGKLRCVFIEAKAKTYRASALPNHLKMTQAGYNSSINGQLSLKHRFAKALKDFTYGKKQIREPDEISEAYRDVLGDPLAKPRYLQKEAILDRIIKPLGLCGLPETSCYYVALTWDREPDQTSTDEKGSFVFFDDEEVTRSVEGFHSIGLPVFLDAEGEEQFENMKSRVGWLGYVRLEKLLGLLEGDANSEYLAARSTMVKSPQPDFGEYEKHKLVAMSELPEPVQELAKRIADYVRARRPGAQKPVEYTGSYSVHNTDGRPVLKIIPGAKEVFVGVRELVSQLQIEGCKVEKSSVRGVEFVGIKIPCSMAQDCADAPRYKTAVDYLISQLESDSCEEQSGNA